MGADAGLKKALKAAGGYRPLARALGIDPSAVFQWSRIPAHRIVQIEEATGVDRAILRPDLYRQNETGSKKGRSRGMP
jgi:DNA-binding transcriptional regulator YdaS (Cro superfamily)